MGIGKRFSRASAKHDQTARPRAQATPPPILSITVSATINPACEITGTTTFGRDAVAALVKRRGLPERGMLECQATLQRESDNPVDPQAVAVHVDGERVGYLPSFVAAEVPLHPGEAWPVPLQLFSLIQPTGVRAKAWVWLKDGTPKWLYSTDNPPPLTAPERRVAAARATSAMVAQALAEGGERAAHFRDGIVDGYHYLELIEPIQELKRQGRLREALELCYRAILGAERDAQGREPAPAYTEHAAIIHRKLGERDQEIAVLQRWLDHTPAGLREGTTIEERLAKLLR